MIKWISPEPNPNLDPKATTLKDHQIKGVKWWIGVGTEDGKLGMTVQSSETDQRVISIEPILDDLIQWLQQAREKLPRKKK